MATLELRITDIETGRTRLRVYRGPRIALEALKADIEGDRGGYGPPGTAIHTPVPPGVDPTGFVPSFLVVDPIVIRDD